MVLSERIWSIPSIRWKKEFLEEVKRAANQDSQYQAGLQSQHKSPEDSDYIKPSEYLTKEDGLLYYKLRLYVPASLVPNILESKHDSRVAGHFGQDKTIELVRRNFWWPGVDKSIINYIRSCPNCQADKARRHK